MNEQERAVEVLNELAEIDSENPSNFRRRAEIMTNYRLFPQAKEDLQFAKILAKNNGNSKEILLIRQEQSRLEILEKRESYWLIE
jgi:regulator of sirC expression with transglutaminase-like and TPR domain